MSTRKPSHKLVIVESPAKARTISKFLGRTYKVEASNGHVRDLPKSQLGVDIENGFEPKYITIRGQERQVRHPGNRPGPRGRGHLLASGDHSGH